MLQQTWNTHNLLYVFDFDALSRLLLIGYKKVNADYANCVHYTKDFTVKYEQILWTIDESSYCQTLYAHLLVNR